MSGQSVFSELNAVDVNGHTDTKKNGGASLTYLSWPWAISEVMKRYPNVEYEVVKWDGKPYLFDENLGYMVMTRVSIAGQTREMWLPVMDGANHAMKAAPYTIKTKYKDVAVAQASMFDINKAIMRCLVKNLAMFGLGLYIYAGEDLPEGEEGQQTTPHPQKANYQAKEGCIDSLSLWKEYFPQVNDKQAFRTIWNIAVERMGYTNSNEIPEGAVGLFKATLQDEINKDTAPDVGEGNGN